VPKEGPRYEKLVEDLDQLWRAHHDASGLVSLAYRTFVCIVEYDISLRQIAPKLARPRERDNTVSRCCGRYLRRCTTRGGFSS